jgi:DnaJ-class molecular chaperone
MWGGKGDHLVRIGIRIPKNVNKKLQKALEELEDLK